MADTPSLDDRRFQDLVDDAKQLLRARAPGPDSIGEESESALIEAAALMVDQLIYRLNQVPDRLHTALLDLVGVRPYPPRAARTLVTFWLVDAPAESELVIPAGVAVSTVGADRRVFTTLRPLRLPPIRAARLLVQRADGASEPIAQAGRLSDPLQVGDALLVGLSTSAPDVAVVFDISCHLDGVGVPPNDAPLVWEAWGGDDWVRCDTGPDETAGLSRSGRVVVHLPPNHGASTIRGEDAGWVRCRIIDATPLQPSSRSLPVISGVEVATVGGSVEAVHGRRIPEELLGTSTGLPGQRFRLRDTPMVEPDETVTVEVLTGGVWTPWRVVPTFADSGPADQHVQIAASDSEARFGPAIRQPDGSRRYYGAVPHAGALIRMRNHLVGGGRAGNLGPGMLSVLLNVVPYVGWVENRLPSFGGADGETIADAKARVPLALGTRNRAVTAADYEHLAREAAPELARVRCVADDQPGGVRVILVPPAADTNGRTNLNELLLANDTLMRVAERLDACRVVGTRVIVEPARYLGVTVVASLRCQPRARIETLHDRVLETLYRYYHPLIGGPDGTGWPFGRPVIIGEVFAVLQRIPGVDVVEDVQLYGANPVTGEHGEAVQRLDLAPDALVFSYGHQIRVYG